MGYPDRFYLTYTMILSEPERSVSFSNIIIIFMLKFTSYTIIHIINLAYIFVLLIHLTVFLTYIDFLTYRMWLLSRVCQTVTNLFIIFLVTGEKLFLNKDLFTT